MSVVARELTSIGPIELETMAPGWQLKGPRRQFAMADSYPCQPPIPNADSTVAPHQVRGLETQVGALKVRRRIESGIDSRLKSRKPVIPWNTHMQMGVQSPLSAISHQDLHLSDRQVLDVFVLGSSVFDVSLAAKSDWLVLFFEHTSALDGQCAPLL